MDGVVTYDEVARWLPRGVVSEIEEALGWGRAHGTLASYHSLCRCAACLEVARSFARAQRLRV